MSYPESMSDQTHEQEIGGQRYPDLVDLQMPKDLDELRGMISRAAGLAVVSMGDEINQQLTILFLKSDSPSDELEKIDKIIKKHLQAAGEEGLRFVNHRGMTLLSVHPLGRDQPPQK